MKKAFIILTVILCFKSIFANDNFVLVTHNSPVSIYPTAFATIPKRIIQQVDEVEALYTFKVIDDSLFRFKVQIFEPDRCVSNNGEPYLSSVGWIDKINTSVFIGATLQDNGETCIRLHEKPMSVSKFVSIAQNDHILYTAYVDSISDNWYHVIFIYENKLYTGWINTYCINPYGGCN